MIGAVTEHALSLQRQKPLLHKGFCGGAEGIRTLDPLTASHINPPSPQFTDVHHNAPFA